MRISLSQSHSKSRCVAVIAALGVFTWTSGCGTEREKNFKRSNEFTDLAAQIDSTAPSDIRGLQGQATYTGTAFANFGEFEGTANARLTADFDTKTIAGSMTSWKDLDPYNHVLRGQVQLSNGSISDNGSFRASMAGNIERDTYGPYKPSTPVLKVFEGTAGGQIYNSVDGVSASHVKGSFTGTDLGGGSVDGVFILGR